MGKSSDVRNALAHRPALIPHYMRHPCYDRMVTQGILHRMLPLRTSIELECTNGLAEGLMADGRIPKGMNALNTLNTCQAIRRMYGLHSYDQDFGVDAGKLTEHRISISGYRQAVGLSDILKDIKRHCKVNDGGGIHIHVDVSMLMDESANLLVKFFERKLDEVERIFGKYTGTYNRKTVGLEAKSTWVNVRLKYQSVEFRIGGCTFDYDTIMGWMIGCNRLVKEFCAIKGVAIPRDDRPDAVSADRRIAPDDVRSPLERQSILGNMYIGVDGSLGFQTYNQPSTVNVYDSYSCLTTNSLITPSPVPLTPDAIRSRYPDPNHEGNTDPVARIGEAVTLEQAQDREALGWNSY